MPTKNHDLHGSAPDKSSVAFLLIDVINVWTFPKRATFCPMPLRWPRQIASLIRRRQTSRP